MNVIGTIISLIFKLGGVVAASPPWPTPKDPPNSPNSRLGDDSPTTSRTIVEARNELVYSVQLWLRAQRLYRRIRIVLGFITIAGGSAALGFALGGEHTIPGIINGIIVMLSGGIDLTLDPASLSEKYGERYRAYSKAEAKVKNSTSRQAVDAELAALRPDDLPVGEGLRVVADRDMLRAQGYPEKTLGRWHTFLAWIS